MSGLEDWLRKWQTENPVDLSTPDTEAAQWLLARPPAVQAVFRRFPPLCLVKGTRSLRCPAPGRIGFVYSVLEHNDRPCEVTVVHAGDDSDNIKAVCDLDWLEVVGYRAGCTPEAVAHLLDKHAGTVGTDEGEGMCAECVDGMRQ